MEQPTDGPTEVEQNHDLEKNEVHTAPAAEPAHETVAVTPEQSSGGGGGAAAAAPAAASGGKGGMMSMSFLIWITTFWTAVGLAVSSDCDGKSGLECAEDQKDSSLALGIIGLFALVAAVALNFKNAIYSKLPNQIGECALIALSFTINGVSLVVGGAKDCALEGKTDCNESERAGYFLVGCIGAGIYVALLLYFKALLNFMFITLGAPGIWSLPRSAFATFTTLFVAIAYCFQQFFYIQCVDDAGRDGDKRDSCYAYAGTFFLAFSCVGFFGMVVFYLSNIKQLIDLSAAGFNLGQPIFRSIETYASHAIFFAWNFLVFFTGTLLLCVHDNKDDGKKQGECFDDNIDGMSSLAIIGLIITLLFIVADAVRRVMLKVPFF